MSKEIKILKQTALQIRRDVLEMGPRSGNVCHVGPAFSCTDIVTALYFKFLRIDPKNPMWEDRDRFIISKGHGATCVYSALARLGYFEVEELWKIKQMGASLQGHPCMRKTPGIDMTSGSLGNGLSIGLGMAIGLKYKKKKSKAVVILGDGEVQEGMIWEAAMCASVLNMDNLTAIIDYNHHQSSGSVDLYMSLEPLADKWKSFGWNVLNMNGHDMNDIISKLEISFNFAGKPTVIIAHTIKGKGVSFMENNNEWHTKMPSAEHLETAMRELDAEAERIERQYPF